MCTKKDCSLCLYFNRFLIQDPLCSILIYPKKSFFTSLLLKFCFYEVGFPFSNIRTVFQISFAAAIQRDVTKVPSKFFKEFSVFSVTICLRIWIVDPFSKFPVIKNNAFFLLAVTQCFSQMQQCYISFELHTVFHAIYKTRHCFC